MPMLSRPDGAEIWWEAKGDGPLVVIADLGYSPPDSFEPLVRDLAADHRVVTYHVRGTGRSSRVEPYDIDTDAADLGAVVTGAGSQAVIVAAGDGCNRALRLAVRRPELVELVVCSGTPPLGEARGDDALAGSREVIAAMLLMFEGDYRAGLHSMVHTGAPYLNEDEVRARVDEIAKHAPQDVAAARMRAWIDDAAALQHAVEAGNRLVILHHDRNPWFGAALTERLKEFLPDAVFVPVEDGALHRPDLAAAAIRSRSPRAPRGPG